MALISHSTATALFLILAVFLLFNFVSHFAVGLTLASEKASGQ